MSIPNEAWPENAYAHMVSEVNGKWAGEWLTIDVRQFGCQINDPYDLPKAPTFGICEARVTIRPDFALIAERDKLRATINDFTECALKSIPADWKPGYGRDWSVDVMNILAEYIGDVESERDKLRAEVAELRVFIEGMNAGCDSLRAEIAKLRGAQSPVIPELPEPIISFPDENGRIPLFNARQLHAYAAQFAAAQNEELVAQRDDAEGRFRAVWNSHVAKNMECERLQARIVELEARMREIDETCGAAVYPTIEVQAIKRIQKIARGVLGHE